MLLYFIDTVGKVRFRSDCEVEIDLQHCPTSSLGFSPPCWQLYSSQALSPHALLPAHKDLSALKKRMHSMALKVKVDFVSDNIVPNPPWERKTQI